MDLFLIELHSILKLLIFLSHFNLIQSIQSPLLKKLLPLTHLIKLPEIIFLTFLLALHSSHSFTPSMNDTLNGFNGMSVTYHDSIPKSMEFLLSRICGLCY